MARVPASIPKEPGAQRCGDSYKSNIFVTGLIPGTDFGGQFDHSIDSVKFGNSSYIPSTFSSNTEFRRQLNANNFEGRLRGVITKLELDAWAYKPNEAKSLRSIAEAGLDLLQSARVYAAAGPPRWSLVQQKLTEAAQHLRCVEYWTWRIYLVQQAVQEYEPPLGLATGEPPFEIVELFPDFPIPGLGSGPTTPPPTTPKKKEGVSPWLIAGGLGLAAAVYYFTRKK